MKSRFLIPTLVCGSAFLTTAPLFSRPPVNQKSDGQIALGLLRQFLRSSAQSGRIHLEGELLETGATPEAIRRKSTFELETELQGEGKIRFTESLLGIPTTDNPPKVYYSSKITSFNGAYWTASVSKRGWLGEMDPVNEAVIANSGIGNFDDYWCGLNYFVDHSILQVYDSAKVKDVILGDESQLMTHHLSVTSVVENGVKLLKLEIPDAFSTETLWLDPARGYLIVRKLVDINHGGADGPRVIDEEKVEDVIQAGLNVWYPKVAHRKRQMDGKVMYEQTWRISAAKFFPGRSMDDVEMPKLQPGCQVTDFRKGVEQFKVGEDAASK